MTGVDVDSGTGSVVVVVVGEGIEVGVSGGKLVGVAVGVDVICSVGEGVTEGREVGGTAVFVGDNVAAATIGSGSSSDVGVQAVNPPIMKNKSRNFVYHIFIASSQV